MEWFIVYVILTVVTVSRVEATYHDGPSNCWNHRYSFPRPQTSSTCAEDGLCNCEKTTADCSAKHLTYIPYVNQSYLHLNFSNNNVTDIHDEKFFSNVSREVKVIDLFNNGLRHIAPGAFRGLHNLTTLFLGGFNNFGYQAMPALLSIPKLYKLVVSCLRLGDIPGNMFQGVNTTVIDLDLSWNHIQSMNLSALQPLRNLRSLFLWRNIIYDLETTYMPSLRVLGLEANRLFKFPVTCSQSGTSLFPHLTNLSLHENMIDCIDVAVCLPSLFKLGLSYNNFKYFTTDMFPETLFPGLQLMSMMQMENKIVKVDEYFLNNSVLERINFNFNSVDFSAVSEDAFGGCTNVNELSLRGNNFQKMTDDKFHRLLEPMHTSLLILYLSDAQITHVTTKTFSRLTNLTRLYLYGNSLFSLPDGAFDHLPKLNMLILSRNHIAIISQNTFGLQLQKGLKKLALGGNPFHCSCDILWFQRWMKDNPIIFKDYHTVGYHCNNVDNVTVPDFILNDQACMLGSDAAAFTIALTCVFIFVFLLFTIFFRYRWHVRLWLYEVCRSRRSRRARVWRRFKYDVFVSYAEEDMGWVEHELMPVLEGQWGLKLCLHQRDFLPGKHIVDNITDCVDESDRVLVVFSPHFARSEWCQFELRFCQTSAMDRDDVMVLVTLQDTPSRDIRGAMLAILRTTTYIEWGEGRDATASFWGRLRLALEESGDFVDV